MTYQFYARVKIPEMERFPQIRGLLARIHVSRDLRASIHVIAR